MRTIRELFYFSVSLLTIFFISSGAAKASASELCEAREGSLLFVLGQQTKQDGPVFKRGEWPSVVNLSGWPKMLGILKAGYLDDRNLFTTVSIHNLLAEIYLKYSRDSRLLTSMQLAATAIPEYRTKSGAYNFWPKVLGYDDLHLPYYQLTNETFSGTLAVPADADDTALAQLAYHLRYQVCLANSQVRGADCVQPEQNVERYYTPYRDQNRMPAPSNMFRGEITSGAYMTWMFNESWIPNMFEALSSQSAGPRVVLDKNDVDCVVNANVLRTLTAYQRTNAPGYADACRVLRSNAVDGDYSMCGHYYPDTYWFHYAVARAYEDGASCLQQPAAYALAHLLKKQKPNGSWHNEMFNNDEILATAFALGALLKTGNSKDPKHVQALRSGLNYLMSRKEKAYNQVYWSGGIFFSAGYPVRHHVQWYSHSFTTATINYILFEAQKWLPEARCAN